MKMPEHKSDGYKGKKKKTKQESDKKAIAPEPVCSSHISLHSTEA